MFASQGIATPVEAQPKESYCLVEQPKLAPMQDELPQGALIEISGPEARAQAARILAENRHAAASWIEEQLQPFPEEVLRSRINVDRVLFVEGGKDSSWAVSSLVSSGHFPIVVYRGPYENEKFLRRLRRFAKTNQCTVFLLREEPCFSWTIRVQLRAVNGKLEVLRWRSQ